MYRSSSNFRTKIVSKRLFRLLDSSRSKYILLWGYTLRIRKEYPMTLQTPKLPQLLSFFLYEVVLENKWVDFKNIIKWLIDIRIFLSKLSLLSSFQISTAFISSQMFFTRFLSHIAIFQISATKIILLVIIIPGFKKGLCEVKDWTMLIDGTHATTF